MDDLKVPLWNKIINTRTVLSTFALLSAVFVAYVQQAETEHVGGFYWERLVAAVLSLFGVLAALYVFYGDVKRNNIAWVRPRLNRPWFLFHSRKKKTVVTDVPYFGEPYNVVTILVGCTQTAQLSLAFYELQKHGKHSPLKFPLVILVLVSFAGRARGSATVRCGGRSHSCTGYLIGNDVDGDCDGDHEDGVAEEEDKVGILP